jgi:aminoglycoside phosphotransferase (APT) family kinase protein
VWFVRSASGQDIVVKFHAGDVRRQLGKERFIYDQAAPVPGLLVPRILGFDEEAAVLSRISGVELGTVLRELTSEDLATVSEQLGATVKALHSLVQPAFGYLLAGVHEPAATNAEYLARTFDAFLSDWSRYGGEPEVAKSIDKMFSDRADLFDLCEQAVICHDDLNPANILIERRLGGWQLSGIIDFENGRAADPLMDIAKAGYYLFSSVFEILDRSAFIRGYGGLPEEAGELVPVYRVWSDLEMWVHLARAGTIGWRPALEEDLAQLTAGAGW